MILVTGASGTAGSEVAKALAGVAHARATRARAPADGERWFDLEKPASWAPALDGIEAAFLMLPPGLPKARQRFRAMLGAARAAGVKRIVFLSVRNADRLTILPHRGIEEEAEQSGLAWTHLRPNDWMQNFATQPLYRNDIVSGELWAPNGRSRTSYIDVRDVAAVAAKALTGGFEGQALSLTGPSELGLDEVATIFSDVLGRRVVNRDPSLPGFFRHARSRGTPTPLAAIMASIGLVARLGFARGIDPDGPRLLGRPSTDFGTFVRDYRHCWTAEPDPAWAEPARAKDRSARATN